MEGIVENTIDFKNYIPESAVAYCQKIIGPYSFRFILKSDRSSKLGDFRNEPGRRYSISVNQNLNPYQFLLTFIHELAHLKVAEEQQGRVKPHGKEWKLTFKELMLPLLRPEVFPDEILRPLARHIRKPKAAASSDPILWQVLQKFNQTSAATTLAEIAENERFRFKKREFIKLKKRRTRVLCQEVNTRRQYLIPEIAEVHKVL